MSELSWTGLVIYFLSITAIVLWSAWATGSVRKSLERRKDLIKKVSIGILVISAAYWWITIPYVGSYYDFSDKLEYPTSGEAGADPSKYLQEHHQRIQSLEREVKRRNEESRQLRAHYEIVLQLAFYAILYYGCMLIFNKRPDASGDDTIKLNLNE